MPSLSVHKTPIVIIGAGVAGLFTALKLAPLRVLVLTAGKTGKRASSTWAQGGLAAAIGADDSADLHYTDTVNAGAGLVVPRAATLLTQTGAARVEDLIDLGVRFDRDATGDLKLGREAAHSRNRIVHASGDRAGATIMASLIESAQEADHITLKERHVAEEVLTRDGVCAGVLVHDISRRERLILEAGHIILATGGIGGLFAVTTNPIEAQGHGVAMALRAGALVIDPEFTQFHPTALDVGADPAPLATEALRGEGGILVDRAGHRFMTDLHPEAELAPRDIVARGVAQAIRDTQGAFLDTRAAIGDSFAQMYPTVFEAAMRAGLDPAHEPLPIIPAVHYHMGGVGVDHWGETSVEGLWAVGEVASTGVHGANRLASNSLLETLVYGDQCAHAIKGRSPGRFPPGASPAGASVPDAPASGEYPPDPLLPLPDDRRTLRARPAPPQVLAQLRQAMSAHCGILRTEEELESLTGFIAQLEQSPTLTSGLKNTLLCARAIAHAARHRQESRGSHERLDYPETGDPAHTLVQLDDTGLCIKNGSHAAQ